MPLISTSIPNLINGVSQQAPSIRLASELEAQENAYSSVVEGLSKRPPTKHIKRLGTEDITGSYIHTINRDETERYTVVLTNGDLKVFDMAGNAKTVTFPDGKAYLDTLTPDKIMRCLTVEDFTFILNSSVTVSMLADLSPFPGNQGIVFVKQGAYSTKYDVYIDNYTAVEKLTSDTVLADIRTDAIATALATSMGSTLTDLGGVTSATWTEGSSFTIPVARVYPAGANAIKLDFYSNPGGIGVGDSVKLTAWELSPTGISAPFNGQTFTVTAVLAGGGTFPYQLVVYTPVTYTAPFGSNGYWEYGTATQLGSAGIAGQLHQTGAFAAYTPHDGDYIYLVSGTGITLGSYPVVGIETGGSGCHSNDFISLKLSPSTAHVNLAAGDIASDNSWIITHSGSTVLIKRKDGGSFTLKATDSFGNNALKAFKDTVQHFTDLPTVAVKDYVVKISGDASTNADDFYVKFIPNNQTILDGQFDSGVWVETLAPSIPYKLNGSTMPHVLVRNGDGTFTFREQVWGDRGCGDSVTNPDPSFVGQPLNDIFFFRDRLGLLAGENVILSQAGSFFAFFRSTVTTTLDDDPIDIAATHTSVSELKYAVPFQEELVLFADQCQFTLHAATLLTPSTVVLDQSTTLEASLQAKPVPSVDDIYFAFPRGNFTGMREYFLDPQTVTKTASDITAHVPRYIPGVATKLAACSSEDLLAVLCSGDPSAFYLYKYYWSNNQKIQSAWSRFSFESGASVLNLDFIQTTAYLIVQRSDGYYLESMAMEAGRVDDGSAYVTLLDRRIAEADCVSVIYNAGTNLTTWTLPYPVTGPMAVAVRAGDTSGHVEGESVVLASQSGSTLTAHGDFSASKVYIGQKYTMSWRLSEQVRRAQSPNGSQLIDSSGRLQLRTFTIVYDQSGSFWTEVTPLGRDTSVKLFDPLVLGVGAAGAVALQSGKFRFAVLSLANQVTIDVKSDSHLPCHFTSAEYEGFYSARSQRN